MWQTVAVWLAVGAVIIWIAAGIFRRYLFRDNGKKNDGKPPCCG